MLKLGRYQPQKIQSSHLKTVPSRMLSLLYFLDFSFKFITCLLLYLAMITVHFNYAKRRLDILKLLSMCHPLDGQIGRCKHVKGEKKCLMRKFLSVKKTGDKIFA